MAQQTGNERATERRKRMRLAPPCEPLPAEEIERRRIENEAFTEWVFDMAMEATIRATDKPDSQR